MTRDQLPARLANSGTLESLLTTIRLSPVFEAIKQHIKSLWRVVFPTELTTSQLAMGYENSGRSAYMI